MKRFNFFFNFFILLINITLSSELIIVFSKFVINNLVPSLSDNP